MFFMEQISFSLKLFSYCFYGQSFVKTKVFKILLYVLHVYTRNRGFLEVKNFKMVIKVGALKSEVSENATLSMVNTAINDNHRL